LFIVHVIITYVNKLNLILKTVIDTITYNASVYFIYIGFLSHEPTLY